MSNAIISDVRKLLADVTAGRLLPTVYNKLEERPKVQSKQVLSWWQAGNTGNNGGASSIAHGTYEWLPLVPELVTINPVAAFDNYFYLLLFPIPAQLPENFVISFDNYSATKSSAAGVQALEFQLELRDGTNVYNMAWQFDQASKSVRAFHYLKDAKGSWFAPKAIIPYPDISQGLSVKAEFRIDRQAETVTHTCLWLNGVQYIIELTQKAEPEPSEVELSAAFQVDPNSANPVSVELSNVSVAWL